MAHDIVVVKMRESRKVGRFTIIRISEDEIPNVAKGVVGGRGLNSAILWSLRNRIPAHWMNPKNVVCIGAGPFAGSEFPSTGRTTISVLKSPVTGFWSDGNLGGYFGAALRRAGIACLVLIGKMSHPHCIHITKDGLVRLLPISRTRFLTYGTKTTAVWVEREYCSRENAKVTLAIGPAGANGVFCAVPVSGDRTAGGGGTGAVLGSKLIKSITVEYDPFGDSIEFATFALKKGFSQVAEEAKKKIESHPVFDMFSEYGTTSLIEIHAALDYLPVNNWNKSIDKRWPKVSGQTLRDSQREFYKPKKLEDVEKKYEDDRFLGCSNCPIHCSNIGKIEYETLNCLGPKIGIYDLDFITATNMVDMNDTGMDVIQSTSVIAALMNMYEDGVSYYSFKWGDKTHVASFFTEMAGTSTGEPYTWGARMRDGFYNGILTTLRKDGGAAIDKLALGDVLSDDPVLFERWSKAKSHKDVASLITDYYYVHSKGYGMSGVYINDKNKGVALAVATSTRGADHLRSLPTLATYADWYLGGSSSGSWLKRVVSMLKMPLKALWLMKAEQKNLIGDLYKTYQTTFGVPKEITDKWQESGFLHNPEQTEGWGSMVKFCQEMYAVSDALGTCKFTSSWRFGVGVEILSHALTLTRKNYYDWKALLQVGERINAIERQLRFFYKYHHDFDDIPQKFYNKNIKNAITRERMQDLLTDFNHECGYRPGGYVSDEKWKSLINRGFDLELLRIGEIITTNVRRTDE